MKFNEKLDLETVNNTTFKILKGDVQVAITTPSVQNFDTVVFSTQAALEANTNYKLVIEGVKSEKGSEVTKKEVSFKTATETVVRSVGADTNGDNASDETLYQPGNVTAVPNITGNYVTASRIIVTLDEAVDKTTLTSSSVKLKDVTTGKFLSVEASAPVAAQPNLIAIKVVGINDYLTPRNSYQLVLDGVKAANGNTVEAFAFDFSYKVAQPTLTTANFLAGDTTVTVQTAPISPLLEGSLLGDKSTFKPGAKIDVDFGAANAKLDKSTITTENFKLVDVKTDKSVAINVSYNEGVNKVSVTPVNRLEDNGEYRLKVSKNIKDVNGLNLAVAAGKESVDSAVFTTLDVTAPTVKGITTVDGDLNNVEISKPTTFKVEFSEALNTAPTRSDATTYAGFLDGTATGNILIQRADTGAIIGDGLGANQVQTTVTPLADGKSYNISLQANDTNLRGVAFKVTFAGYNPQRYAGTSKPLILDQATIGNALASDYEVYFTVEGQDTVAPKFTGAKTTLASGETEKVELKGATNVNDLVYVTLDEKVSNINTTTGKVELLQNGSVVKTLTKGSVGTPDEFDYQTIDGKAAIVFDQSKVTGAIIGPVQLRVSGVKDNSTNANESTTYRVDYVAGKGQTVDKVTFVDKDSLSGSPVSADKAAIKVEFDGAMDRTSLTNSTVKLMDGETVVSSSLDFKDFTSSGNTDVYLVPDSALSAGKTYKVVVTKDAKDANGNALQPNAIKAPKDYTVNVTTTTSGDIQVAENGVYDEAARTVTFNFTQDVNTTVLVIKNKATGDIVSSTSTATIDSKDAKKVVVTLNDAFTKNTEYEVGLTANATGSNTVATSTFVPTKNLKVDSVVGAPEVSVGAVNTLTGATILTFTEPVKVSDVKAAVKVYNATKTADVKLFDSSFAYTETSAGYASSVTVTIPGYDSTNDYYLTIAEGSIADEAGFKNEDAVEVTLSAGGGADLTAPVVTGVIDGQLTNSNVTPASADTDIDTVSLTKGGSAVAGYTLGTPINDEGVYVLTVTDKSGNFTVVNFEIDTTAPAPVSSPLMLSDGFKASGLEVGATVKVVNAGDTAANTAVSTATVDSNGDVTVTGLTTVTSYEVFVIDAAGNASVGLSITTI